MRHLTVLLLVAVLVPTTVLAQPETEKAADFYESAFSRIAARSPMFEAQLNIRDQYHLWDDLSESYQLQTWSLYEELLKELSSTVDVDQLDEEGRLSYTLFKLDVGRRMKGIEWRDYAYPVNQMYGWQSRVPAFLISYHRVDTVEDADAYIKRLEGVDRLFQQVIAQMKKSRSKGVIAPKFVFGHVLSDSRNVISGKPFDDGDDSTILKDFKKKVDGLEVSNAERNQLIRRAERALLGPVRQAYENLIAHSEELQSVATTDDGVWKLPDGDRYYQYRLEAMTTMAMTASEIHDVGLREVARIHDEMRAIMKKVEFKGDLKAFFDHLREDEQFYYPNTDDGRSEYLIKATEIIDNMRTRLDDLFYTKPERKLW